MKVYLSFLLIIIFLGCGGGDILADKSDIKYTTYNKGDVFIAQKGDSIIASSPNTEINVTRNVTSEKSTIVVILGSVSFFNAK